METPRNEPSHTRREFFKRMAKRGAEIAAATTAAVITAGVLKETHTESTIETRSGRFTGIYEIHTEYSKDSPALALPNDTDVLFREATEPLSETLMDPDKIILGRQSFSEKPLNVTAFSDRTLLAVAQKQIPLMFGDVEIGDFSKIISDLGSVAKWGVTYLSLKTLQDLKEKQLGEKNDEVRRRIILRTLLTAIAAWGTSGIITEVAVTAGEIVSKNNAIRRIMSQSDNVLSAGHPEMFSIHFRNALIADKLLHMSELLGEQLGQKPHIAFNVGYGHRGIEDFLQAGRDFCRKFIASFPIVLGDTIKHNGGTHTFSSSLLYMLPKDLNLSDIQAGNLRGQPLVVTDNELKSALQ